WLSEFEHLLSKRKYDSLKHLLREDSWLRDILVFSWNLRTINGSARILDFLLQSTNDKELDSLSCEVSGHFQPSLRSVSSDLIALSGCSTSRRPWIEVLELLRLVPGCSSHWKAYMTLVTHDPTHFKHMPYVEFPATWPILTPKDKLVDFLGFCATIIELNTIFDPAIERWTVHICKRDFMRIMHPRHLVLATALAGEGIAPNIPGDEFFAGVTMLQRGGTLSMRNALSVLQGLYDEIEPPIHEADLYSDSFPIPAQSALGRTTTKHLAEQDKELLDNLNKAGFKVDFGHDGSGVLRKALTHGEGYGHQDFWYMGGTFGWCRSFSKLLALQIKATEERLYTCPTRSEKAIQHSDFTSEGLLDLR
ncbi:hypothetical protein M747DRAFT_245708, partial [Aspergillus niger ATCC 13496]